MHARFRSEQFNVVTCLPEVLSKPLHWRKPRVVFIDCADLFHEAVPDEFIAAVFGVMAACPQHTFLVCTKRAARMRKWFEWVSQRAPCMPEGGSHFCGTKALEARAVSLPLSLTLPLWPLPNVWLGVTAEDQQRADERIPLLLATPAAHRWISCEPLLGPINFSRAGEAARKMGVSTISNPIDQVIAGAESGREMRPCANLWVQSVVDQCAEVRSRDGGKLVPCFVKQIHDGKRLVTDPALFPAGLRVRDLAWQPATKGVG